MFMRNLEKSTLIGGAGLSLCANLWRNVNIWSIPAWILKPSAIISAIFAPFLLSGVFTRSKFKISRKSSSSICCCPWCKSIGPFVFGFDDIGHQPTHPNPPDLIISYPSSRSSNPKTSIPTEFHFNSLAKHINYKPSFEIFPSTPSKAIPSTHC